MPTNEKPRPLMFAMAVAKLTVTKCLADREHVDPDAPLLNGYVRPE